MQKMQKNIFVKIIIYIVIALTILQTCFAVEISEILFDADGNDNNKEFIEIYSNEKINFSNSNISDSDTTSIDHLILLKQTNSSFYLIVEEGFDITNTNCTIYSAGPTIGNNLNNDKDTIIIQINSTKNISIDYNTNSFPEFIPGNSLSKKMELNSTNKTDITNIFRSIPTPCAYNIIITSNNEEQNETQINKTNNCTLKEFIITRTIFDDETIEFSFNESKVRDNYSIEYWIEDSSGTIVKEKKETLNCNKKQFTPNYKDLIQSYIIKVKVKQNTCNESIEDQFQVFYINTKGQTYENGLDDGIEQGISNCPTQKIEKCETKISTQNQFSKKQTASIEHIYDLNNIKFGKKIKFKLKLQNVNSNNLIEIKIINTSSSITFDFFKGYEGLLTQEIELPKECSKSANLTLKLNAFGLNDSMGFEVKCETPIKLKYLNFTSIEDKQIVNNIPTNTSAITDIKSINQANPLYDILNNQITGNTINQNLQSDKSTIFESKTIKLKELIIPIFAVIISSSVIFFINKRNKNP